MKKRILALALSMCLATTLIPTAWAANKGYTINGTNVTAASGTAVWNCSTYASQVLKKIWTVGTATMTTYNSNYNLLKGKSAAERELTQTHTKEYIQQAPLGARIRICASSDTTPITTTTAHRDILWFWRRKTTQQKLLRFFTRVGVRQRPEHILIRNLSTCGQIIRDIIISSTLPIIQLRRQTNKNQGKPCLQLRPRFRGNGS